MSNQVVARFKDGRVLKGSSLDVDPKKPFFHLRDGSGEVEQVQLADLKALFFVRSFEGDPSRDDATELDPKDPRSRGSTLVRLRFGDGEEIVGLTNHYPPNRPYFFVLPVDPKSNNIRMLINRDALEGIDAV